MPGKMAARGPKQLASRVQEIAADVIAHRQYKICEQL